MDTFLPRVKEYERGEYWTYSHESNFVRLLVILQRGGIYIDSDLIVTKPFAGDFQNSVGHEMPLGMDGGEKVNNNVLIFEPGHPFMIEYLHQMFISYDPKLYHANGPNLITKVYQMAQPEVYNYTVLRGTTFQPVHLNSMPAMFRYVLLIITNRKRETNQVLENIFHQLECGNIYPRTESNQLYRHGHPDLYSCLRTSLECAVYEATIASDARGVCTHPSIIG